MKLPSEIFKEVCQTIGIAFYYGERWKQSFHSIKPVFPAIFMDSVFHRPEGLIQSQYNNIEFSFSICTGVPSKDYANIDFDTFAPYRKAMLIKGKEFLLKIAEYKENGILIVAGEPEQQIVEDLPYQLYEMYAEGVTYNVNWKIIDLSAVC